MLQFHQMWSQTHRNHCTMLQFPQNVLPNAPVTVVWYNFHLLCTKNAPYCKQIPLIWKKVPLSGAPTHGHPGYATAMLAMVSFHGAFNTALYGMISNLYTIYGTP